MGTVYAPTILGNVRLGDRLVHNVCICIFTPQLIEIGRNELKIGVPINFVPKFAEPAKSLPGFFPGHQAGSTHHHVKHGIAALLLGLGAFVLAWFQSGPRTRPEA